MIQSRFLILVLALSAVACSKATPEFDVLDESAIPQPKFSGSTVKNVTVSSSTSTIAISGECDSKIKSIVARAVGLSSGFSALSDLTATAPTVACSNAGTFSFDLKSLSALGYSGFYDGKTFEIQLKGMTSSGLSRASSIIITYSTGAGNRDIWIAGGGIHGGGDSAFTATSAAIKAEIFVNHLSSRAPASGDYPKNTSIELRTGAGAR